MHLKSLGILILFLYQGMAFSQSKINITGKIIDKKKVEPIPFAQIALIRPDDNKTVAGTTSEENGQFTLSAIPGTYDLVVVFVGYEKQRLENITISNSNNNIGTIPMAPVTKELNEVVVKSDQIRQPISTDLEGLSIKPEQTLSNVGGSVLDILRNVPSVSVDQDGNITLRGSNSTNVLVNGRNSVLSSDLSQIPASAVKKIKIINNPNAKYDAEGTGGVINIQLKQGDKAGTNVKTEVTLGTRYRLNTNLHLNHRSRNLNIFGGYSFRNWPEVGTSNTTRETYTDQQRLNQTRDRKRTHLEHTLNFGLDYYLNKNKLSYEGAYNKEDEEDREHSFTRLSDIQSGNPLLEYTRFNDEIENNHSMDNALIYERLYEDSVREFKAFISHSFRNQLENQYIDVYDGTIDLQNADRTGQEHTRSDEHRENLILQADYVQPLPAGKLELGYKTTLRKYDNNYHYEVLNEETGQWENQENISNHFLYRDQVHAAYIIYSRPFDRLDISVGSRLEQTVVNTRLYTTGEKNNQQYLSLFPSFQALYHLNSKNDLKFTYSRRIDRPNSWHLNPFPDVSDSLNVRIGNPDLQPEFIHSLELGHMYNFKKGNLTSNIFFRHVKGQVDWIIHVENGISYRQPTNLNTAMTYGLELINTTQLTDWWNLNASYSIFRTIVDGTNLDKNYTNKGYSWNAKLTTDLNLPYDLDLQITANYEAPEIEAQGRDLARYHVDASVQRAFFNGKGSVNITLRDVFNTSRFAGENYGENFSQVFEYNRESRILLLSLSYKF